MTTKIIKIDPKCCFMIKIFNYINLSKICNLDIYLLFNLGFKKKI